MNVERNWCIHTVDTNSAFIKEGNTFCSIFDGPGLYYANWNKSVTERWIDAIWFNLHKLSKIVKLTHAENFMVVARGWRGEIGSC